MSAERQNDESSLALSRQRHQSDALDEAEVIDLVHLPRGTRPTPIAYLDFEEIERLRVMECDTYQGCLTFASEVRWRSFHCRQCPKNPDRIGKGPQSQVERSSGQATIIRLK